MTVFEYCIECNEPTYNAGKGNGSLYLDDTGPYCDACYYGNLYEGYHRLKAENQRLRGVLEWYADSDNYLSDDYTLAIVWGMNKNIEKKAREALKQEGDQK